MVEDIKKLNKKIEELMKEKARVDAQIGVYKKSLYEGCQKYEKEYGVSLFSDSFDVMKSLIESEFEAVRKDVESDVERAKKVVELIEKGHYTEARKLLDSEEKKEEKLPDAEPEELVNRTVEVEKKPNREENNPINRETISVDEEDEEEFSFSVPSEEKVEEHKSGDSSHSKNGEFTISDIDDFFGDSDISDSMFSGMFASKTEKEEKPVESKQSGSVKTDDEDDDDDEENEEQA